MRNFIALLIVLFGLMSCSNNEGKRPDKNVIGFLDCDGQVYHSVEVEGYVGWSRNSIWWSEDGVYYRYNGDYILARKNN